MGVNKIGSRPAVFLDRDGVIIRYVELLADIRKMRLLPGAAEGIRRLNRLGYLVVVATNQPVVARGLVAEAGIDKIHAELALRLMRLGAKIDAFYFCPHHPNADLPRYRMRCGCRKPGAGMLRRASRELKLNLKKSWMVGDSLIDVVAGQRVGARTVLVKTGPGHARLDAVYEAKPDRTARDLSAASKIIGKSSSK